MVFEGPLQPDILWFSNFMVLHLSKVYLNYTLTNSSWFEGRSNKCIYTLSHRSTLLSEAQSKLQSKVPRSLKNLAWTHQLGLSEGRNFLLTIAICSTLAWCNPCHKKAQKLQSYPVLLGDLMTCLGSSTFLISEFPIHHFQERKSFE